MIATAIPNEAYTTVIPTWAIVIACIWAVIVIAAHIWAFALKSHSNKGVQQH